MVKRIWISLTVTSLKFYLAEVETHNDYYNFQFIRCSAGGKLRSLNVTFVGQRSHKTCQRVELQNLICE